MGNHVLDVISSGTVLNGFEGYIAGKILLGGKAKLNEIEEYLQGVSFMPFQYKSWYNIRSFCNIVCMWSDTDIGTVLHILMTNKEGYFLSSVWCWQGIDDIIRVNKYGIILYVNNKKGELVAVIEADENNVCINEGFLMDTVTDVGFIVEVPHSSSRLSTIGNDILHRYNVGDRVLLISDSSIYLGYSGNDLVMRYAVCTEGYALEFVTDTSLRFASDTSDWVILVNLDLNEVHIKKSTGGNVHG